MVAGQSGLVIISDLTENLSSLLPSVHFAIFRNPQKAVVAIACSYKMSVVSMLSEQISRIMYNENIQVCACFIMVSALCLQNLNIIFTVMEYS